MSGFGPATRLIALLGNPVGHSLSPIFQNAAFRVERLDAVYLALRCEVDDAGNLLRGIARAGGAGNVTLPHKEIAAAAVDRPTDLVSRTGACNTFWLEDGRICGDNTDVAGFRAAVRAICARPAGARVLLLGAGGAARAALHGLMAEGVDAVVVRNRSGHRASDLLRTLGGPERERVTLRDLEADLSAERFDLVVNATSLGLRDGDATPLDLERLGGAGAVLDLVYSPGETEWVRRARQAGVPAADGLEMLIQQGAAAFERWWRRPPPLAAMRAAVHEVIGRSG